MPQYYEMGDGRKIAVAGRGTTRKAIRQLQETSWAKKHGGICGIVEITEEHAIWFAERGL